MRMKSDEELMGLYRRGDRGAFEELFARHHRKVIHFCYRMTGDQASAEDAAQEVFLRIARAAATYEPTAKFTTWMYTVARRTTLNFLRDEKDERDRAAASDAEGGEGVSPLSRVPGPESLNPESMAWSAELSERFIEALRRLPESHRAALVLNRGEGLSYDEVAAVLGVTVQAVKSRIFRAREMLLERLSGFLE